MKEASKLIITATTANSWIHPEVRNWAEDSRALVEDAVACARAGASILHVHLPRSSEATDVVRRIRERTDAIVQAGMSSYPIEERLTDFEARPDMISAILNHHDEHFTGLHVDRLHTLEEFEEYGRKCAEYGIKPEWEVWHTGSYWNLGHLVEKGWFKGPHFLTLFFGWPGGTWSPATPDQYLHLLRYLPEDCVHSVSTMGKEQTAMAALSIVTGGHIRVGTEDNPFIRDGIPAKGNAEIVARAVRLSEELGRPVATPSEAREMLGL